MKTNQNIMTLVEEYPHIAPTLNFLGIQFYDYHDNTLAEVCEQESLDLEWVVSQLEQAVNPQHKESIDLSKYPLQLIVAYLRHSHYLFIKENLRYLAKLIRNYPEKKPMPLFMKDLKLVFPDFMTEFIEHIYEEEDEVFSYILALEQAQKRPIDAATFLSPHIGKSLIHIKEEHQHQDQELQAIRALVDSYDQVDNTSDSHLKVIVQQLKNFAEKLKTHAKIENDILLARAIDIEQELQEANILTI